MNGVKKSFIKIKVYYKGPEQQQDKSTHGAQTLVVADETLKLMKSYQL